MLGAGFVKFHQLFQKLLVMGGGGKGEGGRGRGEGWEGRRGGGTPTSPFIL